MDWIGLGIKSLLMLSLVLGVLVLVVYWMRRFAGIRPVNQGGLAIHRISSLYLSPKERIEVVEIAGEKIVLGVCPGRITFLSKLAVGRSNESASDAAV